MRKSGADWNFAKKGIDGTYGYVTRFGVPLCHWVPLGRCFLAFYRKRTALDFSLKYNVDTSVDIKVERKLYDKVSFDLNV